MKQEQVAPAPKKGFQSNRLPGSIFPGFSVGYERVDIPRAQEHGTAVQATQKAPAGSGCGQLPGYRPSKRAIGRLPGLKGSQKLHPKEEAAGLRSNETRTSRPGPEEGLQSNRLLGSTFQAFSFGRRKGGHSQGTGVWNGTTRNPVSTSRRRMRAAQEESPLKAGEWLPGLEDSPKWHPKEEAAGLRVGPSGGMPKTYSDFAAPFHLSGAPPSLVCDLSASQGCQGGHLQLPKQSVAIGHWS